MSRTTIAIALMFAAAAGPLAAQQTMDAPRTGFRWYLAPTAQVTQLNEETAVLTGLEFGWVKSDRLTLGIATSRLASGVTADQASPTGATDVEFFYSGVFADYAMCAHPGLRIAPRLLLGAGEAHWRDSYWKGMPDPDQRDEEHATSWIAEPAVSVELGILPWLKTDLMGAYRFMGGGESSVMAQGDMSGWSVTLGFRMGQF